MSIGPRNRILLTGGSGRLGSELQQLLPGVWAPGRGVLDLTQPDSIEAALEQYRPNVVVHTAAYTNVAGAEIHRGTCWQVNVEGTRSLVRAASGRGTFVVHISTDYVFDGTRGMYKENDLLGPVRNYYSLTKLVAEEIVRMTPDYLIIRTSFRPREWPYPVAFTDVFTSQDYIDVLAPEIALAIAHCREIQHNTLHIATQRKSVYELARQRKPDVQMGSRREAKVDLPEDISLDVTRWEQIKNQLRGVSKSGSGNCPGA